jgi:PAS domain S-box-containing protein
MSNDSSCRIESERLSRYCSLLNATLQSTADGILVVDRHGHIICWNRKFLELWHIPQELLSHSVFSSFPETHFLDRPVLEYVKKQLANPDKFLCRVLELYDHPDESSEDILELADGRCFERYSQPQLLGSEIIGRVWSFRDVTAKKRTEADLELRSLALDQIGDHVTITDLDGNITYVNQAQAEALGYTKNELIGQNIDCFGESPDQGASQQEILENTKRHGTWRCEVVNRTKDGQEILFDCSTQMVHNSTGRPIALCGLATDITESKKAENELRKINEILKNETARANELASRAEIANVAKTEFLANMSHEIRTPMNGVIGMTGLLLETALTEEQRRYAEAVRFSAESLLGLINDILDVSKIEAGKMELEILAFDLSNLLDDFAGIMAVRAHEKGLELVYGIDADVPLQLRGDPGRLRQILTNLLANAIKFTRKGEVSIKVSQQKAISCENRVVLKFSVTDTGIGIPADKTGLLFEKFSQVDASNTRLFGGTGLGLAISRQLAELMGGEIGVCSEEGKGSEFWFTIPFEIAVDSGPSALLPVAQLQNARVLIIDDNATNRQILSIRVSSWGMRPVEAHDGHTALQILDKAVEAADPFKLAIIDRQMPEMDGETLGLKIRENRKFSDLKMVMLTSFGVRGDAKRFSEMGFDAYLSKPVQTRELQGVLALLLNKDFVSSGSANFFVNRYATHEFIDSLSSTNARILVAEDNIVNQKVALGILQKLGLKADAVADGDEAVKALLAIPYDLVLMDCQMPIMDGYEATRIIRCFNGEISRIPINAMTAHAMHGDRERCIEAGMNDYIAKPVSLSALAEKLEKWLKKG